MKVAAGMVHPQIWFLNPKINEIQPVSVDREQEAA
jgi:hypothetical protein